MGRNGMYSDKLYNGVNEVDFIQYVIDMFDEELDITGYYNEDLDYLLDCLRYNPSKKLFKKLRNFVINNEECFSKEFLEEYFGGLK